MKATTKRFTTLTALALTSVLLLGACGNNKKEATLTSSSSKVSQKVKSSKSSSSKEKTKKSEQKTKSSSSEEVSKATSGEKDSQPSAGNVAGSAQQEVAPTNPSEETAGVNQGTPTEQPAASAEQTPATTVVDATAMANGDFSSVAGTYQNDLGDTITVSPSGSVTRVGAESGYSDTSSQLFNGFAQDGGYVAGFAHNDGPTSDPIFFDSNGQIRFGSDAIYGRMHVYNKLD